MEMEKHRLVLVEDSDDDVVLFGLALKRTGLNQTFQIVRHFPNGEDVISHFNQAEALIETEPRPDIVILDIKLPGRSGFEVLQWIRRLRHTPAIAIFTSSCLPQDRQYALECGADLFQTKTFESEEFSRFMGALARIAEERARQA